MYCVRIVPVTHYKMDTAEVISDLDKYSEETEVAVIQTVLYILIIRYLAKYASRMFCWLPECIQVTSNNKVIKKYEILCKVE